MREPPTGTDPELRGLSFAAGWCDRIVGQIAGLAAAVTRHEGETIFREGEPHESLFFVLSGRVALEMTVPARGPVRLLTLSEGELLGWSPLVGNLAMSATAIALEETRLLELSGPALLRLCDADHELGYAVMQSLAWALSRRLTATRLQLLDLFSHMAPPSVVAADGRSD